MTNTLYYGDNLDILREYIADASVDLVYRQRVSAASPDQPCRMRHASALYFVVQRGSRVHSLKVFVSPNAVICTFWRVLLAFWTGSTQWQFSGQYPASLSMRSIWSPS